jgi:hypothetical protein
MPVLLTDPTLRRLRALFASAGADAERLLVEECGSNLPFFDQTQAGNPDLERIRTAALKLSQGTIDGLREAVGLAKRDWRDLLMAAGFGDDIHAHERWWPGPR